MKIALDEASTRRLNDLLEEKEKNISAGEMFNRYLEDLYDEIDAKKINELMEAEGLSEEQAMSQAFYDLLGVEEEDPYVEELSEENGFGLFTKLSPEEIEKNPYYQNVHLKGEVHRQTYTLTHNYFSPFEGFNCEDTLAEEKNNYSEKTTLGFFAKKVPYLVLMEKGEVWMSITPHEINTMKKAIGDAKGKVLTFGLGLGYFAYMAAEKEEVKEVTVVEKDSAVIHLFEENLLPQFPYKEKIHIVKEDAFHFYERKIEPGEYDFLFIDIYRTAEDALKPYLRFRREEKEGYPKTTYWIEPSILCLLRRYVLTLLEEATLGYTLKDYLDPQSEEEENLLSLRKALEDKTITTSEDLSHLLSDEGLIELAKESL